MKNLLFLLFICSITSFGQSIELNPDNGFTEDFSVKSTNVNKQVIARFNGNGQSHTSLYLNNTNLSANAKIGFGLTRNSALKTYFGIDRADNFFIGVSDFDYSDLKISGAASTIGNVGIGLGLGTPSAKLEVNGFTKLGSDAPAIKIKKLTSGCTTSANSGFPSGEISLTHGITPSKILKVEALVEYATNFWVKDGNDLFGYEFDVYVTNTTISLRNLSGSASSEIRSKPCKILITYEE